MTYHLCSCEIGTECNEAAVLSLVRQRSLDATVCHRGKAAITSKLATGKDHDDENVDR